MSQAQLSSASVGDASGFRSRGYQMEMLDASLQRNIIVAMDTGSGKTHIAILRIRAEIDRMPPKKLIWFLTPTVALCMQQHETISSHLPSVKCRTLVGSDNVDLWGTQEIWDMALNKVQVVVSTYAVLSNALMLGFVHMSRLSLLVFDEAHHCVRNDPANKIMQRYHPRQLSKNSDLPYILGLTASPVVRSKPKELEMLEANLHSTALTPTLHRQELLQLVNRPSLVKISYVPLSCTDPILDGSRAFKALNSVFQEAEFNLLDTIKELRTTSYQKLAVEQLKSLSTKARHIYEELGSWAADYYISASIERLRNNILHDTEYGQKFAEKHHLLKLVEKVCAADQLVDSNFETQGRTSPKVMMLISCLLKEDTQKLSGIIFVEQRATTSVLCALLENHPRTKGRFSCAPFVGASSHTKRKRNVEIGELLDPKDQGRTLVDYRVGKLNMIVATTVLEEGIDVPACHLVVCFNKPANLKSFVQRRGRARKETSTFAIMLALHDVSATVEKWQQLEEEMVRTYQDDLRQVQEAAELENFSETGSWRLKVESTEATLDFESAKSLLHHFCAQLPPQPYVDLRPKFDFRKDPADGLINATVTLPSCVNANVRRTNGAGWWRTERAAMKDASFQAYSALYTARLVNDHLLPLRPVRDEQASKTDPDFVDSVVEIEGWLNPWINILKASANPEFHQVRISISQPGGSNMQMFMVLPTGMPPVQRFQLYWNENMTFNVDVGPSEQPQTIPEGVIQHMRAITYFLLRSPHSRQYPDYGTDFLALFIPAINRTELASWLEANYGTQLATEVFGSNTVLSPRGLVRDMSAHNKPFNFHRWRTEISQEEAPKLVDIEASPLPKRRDFLHRPLHSETVTKAEEQSVSQPRVYSLSPLSASIDRLPFQYVQFALFIPAILCKVEIYLVAQQLRRTLLSSVSFPNFENVVTAILAPNAGFSSNYQRLEFLGDAVLKFIASQMLFKEHPTWHEGYLSAGKDELVSNTSLARAALDHNLDRYIVTQNFTGRKWRPPLISQLQTVDKSTRTVSIKILADVIEALIGAAFLDGGISNAKSCAEVLQPKFQPQPSSLDPVDLQDAPFSPSSMGLGSSNIARLETLLRYEFQNKRHLLQAITHASCQIDVAAESYQRLEFLGDAVLDMIVVPEVFHRFAQDSEGVMTRVKAAVTNADFLAFLCMEYALEEDVGGVCQTRDGKFDNANEMQKFELWKFMRHDSQAIVSTQQACQERHLILRDDINIALKQGPDHPWALLAQLSADKHFSDLVESILGAILVDSDGDLSASTAFAERIGVLPYLRRIAMHDIDVRHPKARFGELADNIEYVVESSVAAAVLNSSAPSAEQEENGLYSCTVKVGGEQVAKVEGCRGREEARVRAADAALRVMSSRKLEVS